MSAIPISQTTERTLAKSDYPVMEVDLMARRSGEKYKEHFEEGFYCCAHCGARLFSSTDKLRVSGRYPAFRRPVARSFLRLHEDFSYGTPRKTASCANCGLYLGMELDTVVDEQPTKCFGILSITVEFEPRANAGDAPTHIEEEDSEEEVVEPPRVVVAPAREPTPAVVEPKSVEQEEEKLVLRPSSATTPTPQVQPASVSISATLVKYAHIALFVAPLAAGLYQKYRSQSHS